MEMNRFTHHPFLMVTGKNLIFTVKSYKEKDYIVSPVEKP